MTARVAKPLVVLIRPAGPPGSAWQDWFGWPVPAGFTAASALPAPERGEKCAASYCGTDESKHGRTSVVRPGGARGGTTAVRARFSDGERWIAAEREIDALARVNLPLSAAPARPPSAPLRSPHPAPGRGHCPRSTFRPRLRRGLEPQESMESVGTPDDPPADPALGVTRSTRGGGSVGSPAGQ